MKTYPWDYRHVYEDDFKGHPLKLSASLVEDIDNLQDSVKNLIALVVECELYYLMANLERCESPIEQLLLVVLMDLFRDDDYITIEPQCEVKLNDATYRVDICIFIGDWLNKFDKCKILAIECDGHDFHEKTKEQARKDKKRDRDLIEAGYQVVHFTGSEIFKDPFECAREIRDLIRKIRDH